MADGGQFVWKLQQMQNQRGLDPELVATRTGTVRRCSTPIWGFRLGRLAIEIDQTVGPQIHELSVQLPGRRDANLEAMSWILLQPLYTIKIARCLLQEHYTRTSSTLHVGEPLRPGGSILAVALLTQGLSGPRRLMAPYWLEG